MANSMAASMLCFVFPKSFRPSSSSSSSSPRVSPARVHNVRCGSKTHIEPEINHRGASWPRRLTDDPRQTKHSENLSLVRRMLSEEQDMLESMVTIDRLQRLGIDYHFQEEIEAILSSSYEKFGEIVGDLFEVTLLFRLFRQSRYYVSPNVLNKFTDSNGRFVSSSKMDIKGMLSLYEASQLNMGEDLLEKAEEFSIKHLRDSIQMLNPNDARLVEQALNHPYHMTVPRYRARHYINHCQISNEHNQVLVELAKLDFNMVQDLHQNELKTFVSWWKKLGLAEELSFVRDQPLKWYLWCMTTIPQPHFSKCRLELAKVVALIYIIDDLFDVHGSLQELVLFTEAIHKWEPSAMNSLPYYMKICYSTLYNITNEFATFVLETHGWNPINSLKKSWAILCDTFLQETKWFAFDQVPNKNDYLRNGVISTGVHAVMSHLFFSLGHGLTTKNIHLVDGIPNLMSCTGTILRLSDDLGSAKDENQQGFDGSYTKCYMKEHPESSIEEACDHVTGMISKTWQILNKESLSPNNSFSRDFTTAALNSARMVRVMYSYDENQKLPMLEDYIVSLLHQRI